jgi:hypothetical protein
MRLTLNRRTALVLMIIFGILSAISVAGCVYFFSIPTEVETTVTLWSYEHTGKYDWVATLKPNNLYNKTTLTPNEGALYNRIVDRLDLRFSYSLGSSKPVEGSFEYYEKVVLETKSWRKVLNTSSLYTLGLNETARGFTTTHSFNVTKFGDIVYSIDKETGIYSTQYNITIEHFINVKARSSIGSIDENFTPSLNIAVISRSEIGDIILVEGQNQFKAGNITEKQKFPLGSMFGLYRSQFRNVALVGFVIAFSIFLLTVWLFMKTSPPKPKEKPLKEVVKPYKDIIAEAYEPIRRRGEVVITMYSLKDLVKVSDNLAKPVLHTQKEKTHSYYVYDGLTKYEYNKDET